MGEKHCGDRDKSQSAREHQSNEGVNFRRRWAGFLRWTRHRSRRPSDQASELFSRERYVKIRSSVEFVSSSPRFGAPPRRWSLLAESERISRWLSVAEYFALSRLRTWVYARMVYSWLGLRGNRGSQRRIWSWKLGSRVYRMCRPTNLIYTYADARIENIYENRETEAWSTYAE